MAVSENTDPVKWTTTTCFEVVGGKSWGNGSTKIPMRVIRRIEWVLWAGEHFQSYPFRLISKTHQAPFKHTITHLDDSYPKPKLKGLLEVVSSSAEFETIPIRRHEDVLLRRIHDRVPVKLDRADFEAPHFKTFLLLQAHFSRLQLPPDLAADQVLVLEKILNHVGLC